MPQPTHHIPAQDPPGHGQRRFGCRTERLGVSRAHPLGTMGQLTDDMHRPIEGEQAAMTMIAYGELAPTRQAPAIFDVEVEACKDRVVGPAVWHDRPFLAWELSGNDYTRRRYYAALAFCRTVDYLYWQRTNRKILQCINTLIRESQRTPFEGIG